MATAMEPERPTTHDSPAPPALRRYVPAPLVARLRRMLPFISLAIGLTSALLMERGPQRGPLIALAGIGVWLMLLLEQWLARLQTPLRPWLARLVWLFRRSSLIATQSLLQLTLFFSLPFFVQAADLRDAGHDVFLFGVIALSAVALWDPLTERLLARPRIGPLLPATASFVALTAVLPGLGLSTFASLWIAACVAGSGMALVLLAVTARGQRARALRPAALVALSLPLALGLGLTRLIPPAPLRLVSIDFGNRVQNHWITQPLADGASVPERLYCATAIASPHGVRDRLFHVWRRNGQPRARIELEIQGGRRAGYRTTSRIVLGPSESGRYACQVETSSGQVLGAKSVQLVVPHDEP
jgi:Family of unknown function (DUF5924)/Protein of unknown function (DUF2914)